MEEGRKVERGGREEERKVGVSSVSSRIKLKGRGRWCFGSLE